MFEYVANLIFTIDEFFAPEECDDYIALSESLGFDEAPITTAEGPVMYKDVRNNDRVMLDDPDRAASLWRRLEPYVSAVFDSGRAVGLNERMRFYRYDPGQQFDWHYDGYFRRENGERSHFTFMVYLNDEFTGGETSFADMGCRTSFRDFQVRPRRGMALVFHHLIFHKGEPVQTGRKYVLRSDVMYAPAEADGKCGR